MKRLLLLLVFLSACSSDVDVNGLEDTEHVGYISIAETWREICDDRYNIYDYPNEFAREQYRAECRRKFASGEEVLELPDIPYEEFQ